MALKIKTKEKVVAPVGQVSVTQSEKGQTIAEDHQQVGADEIGVDNSGAMKEAEPFKPWCQVGYDASYTHNLGDFKSCRVNVSVVIPCQHPEIDECYEYAKEWVENRLNAVIAEVTNGEVGDD